MIYPQDFHNKIINGDCLEVMKEIPDKSIDLVVTSPPYNNPNVRKLKPENMKNWTKKWKTLKLQDSGYDSCTDSMKEPQYILWQKKVLAESLRIIKDTGAIFYNCKWRIYKGLLQQRPELFEGLPVRQIIIWKRVGGFNFNPQYFLPKYEVIYLIAKPAFKLAPKTNAYGDVWDIYQERKSWHPAPFPEELARRCVSSTTGSVILDPFCGSGTVPVVCKKLGKTYIGIDISKDYCDKAITRVDDIV